MKGLPAAALADNQGHKVHCGDFQTNLCSEIVASGKNRQQAAGRQARRESRTRLDRATDRRGIGTGPVLAKDRRPRRQSGQGSRPAASRFLTLQAPTRAWGKRKQGDPIISCQSQASTRAWNKRICIWADIAGIQSPTRAWSKHARSLPGFGLLPAPD